jgi:hypothetical protein
MKREPPIPPPFPSHYIREELEAMEVRGETDREAAIRRGERRHEQALARYMKAAERWEKR